MSTVRVALRRNRLLVAALCAVVVLVVATGLLRPRGNSGPLGTAEAGPEGSLALVRLLGDNGVDVRAADSGPAALQAVAGAAAAQRTVLVTSAQAVSVDLTRRIVDSGARVVLITPSSRQLAAVLPDVRTAATATSPAAEPGCALRAARRAGGVDLSSRTYAVRGSVRPGAATACYPGSSGAALVRVAGSGRRADVDVLGTAGLLRNDSLAAGGAAALALDLLGERPTLVWYRPAAADAIEPGQPGRPLTALLPGWVGPAAAQVAVAALLFALARGRRIGPVVPERLPVVVAAGETTAGRARLYRRHRARDAAAGALRAVAVRDLAVRVGQPVPRRDAGRPEAHPGPVAPGPVAPGLVAPGLVAPGPVAPGPVATGLVAAVAARSGRSAGDVEALLAGPDPDDDEALTGLARGLADLIERTRAT